MTSEEMIQALKNLGLEVRIKTVRTGPRSDNALKSIVLNPACRPETRAAALAELQSRKGTETATASAPA